MTTRVIQVDSLRPDATIIEEAAAILRGGRLVAFPTETVYGLGANALDDAAVQKIFDVKERPATDPLIVHIAHIGQVNQVAIGMPAGARQLALSFWAGPLTLILKKKPEVSGLVTAGRDTVAVRVPSHRVARALMETAGIPIAAPSANRFSRPSPTTAQHVLDDLDGRIDLILDGGATDIGLESTIVDFSVEPPVLRRPGGITLEQVHSLVPDVTIETGEASVEEAQVAPGQLTKHYAPNAPMTVYEGPAQRIVERIAADARAEAARGARIGILAPEDDLKALAPLIAAVAAGGRIEVEPYGSRSDLDRAGRELFGAIRALDSRDVAVIFASSIGSDGLARAIRDRLMRAADGNIRTVV